MTLEQFLHMALPALSLVQGSRVVQYPQLLLFLPSLCPRMPPLVGISSLYTKGSPACPTHMFRVQL